MQIITMRAVSVTEAIDKGKQIINYPAWAIMLAFAGFGMAWVFIDANNWEFILTGFLGAFTLPWLYWSLMINRWRIWAFENVRNTS